MSDFEIETDGVLGINSNVFSDFSIFPITASESSVIIYNLQRQKVFSEEITPENGKINLTVSEISSGIYLLKLTSEGNTITRKLVKN
ncbi:MAG: hypothetical protein ACI9AT_002077 [Ulvibacter sp.]